MKKRNILVILFCITMLFSSTGCAKMILQKSGDTFFLSGIDYYEQGRYQMAIEQLKRAEKYGVNRYENGDLYAVMGHCYLEMDCLDEAFEYYDKSLEEDPDSAIYLTNLAIAYRKDGEIEKAKELYWKAYEIDPDYAELNASIGAMYIWENDPATAIIYLERAIELDPTVAISYGNISLAYAMIGDYETAREYLRQSVALGYANADVIEERINELEKLDK